MKKNLLKLHNQILIALIIGIIFGAIFNVSKSSLVISFNENDSVKKSVISKWESLTVASSFDSTIFAGNQQVEIINKIKQLNSSGATFTLYFKNAVSGDIKYDRLQYIKPLSVKKEKSVPLYLKWIGDIFIRLLNMVAVPLVLASLTVGAASLGDIKKFARIGGKTLAYFLSTTAFAITLGLILANIIKPGERMHYETKKQLLSVYNQEASVKSISAEEYNFTDEIVKIVPKNPFGAMSNSEMLQIVFFALLLGLTLTLIDKDKAAPVLNFFDGLSETMIKMVHLIMYIAPIGVFTLIAAVVSEFGFEIVQTLFWYALTVLLGLLMHTFIVYGSLVKIFTPMNPAKFFMGLKRVQTIAFSTSSSAATLPVNIECCQENLGVSKSITSFVLPLGATVNMDGTALYQGVAAVFIAQVFGMELSVIQQLTIVFTAVLASIGTAPVPGVGIVMLVIILKSVGIPEEGIALILGIDRILDMCRTVTNVTGDAAGAVIVAYSENQLLSAD